MAGSSHGARTKLEAHSFPGNVRELKNVMERAVLESGGGVIQSCHLRLGFTDGAEGISARARSEGQPQEAAGPAPDGRLDETLPASLDDGIAHAELRIVEQAVEEAGGNVSEAARLLGTSRTRLYRILRARE